MNTDEQIKTAIHATIAESILKNLDSSNRDKLLQESITKIIKDWKFSRDIEEVVTEKAKEIAARLVYTAEWQLKIEDAIVAGFDDYLISLRKAVPGALKGTFHGTGSTGVLGNWPKGKEVKE